MEGGREGWEGEGDNDGVNGVGGGGVNVESFSVYRKEGRRFRAGRGY